MSKRSSKVAPPGASCARTSSKSAGLKAHQLWYKHNEEQAKVLNEKVHSGVDLAPKEMDFLSWWAGYASANPDSKRVPQFCASVIRRDKDPME